MGCWSANSWYTRCSTLQDAPLDLLVLRVDAIDEAEVAVEDRLGGGADLLAGLGRELHDVGADLLQLLVEGTAGLGHRRVSVGVHDGEFAPTTIGSEARPGAVHRSFTR